jgi:ubiquitin carboxyl-terminal hydrolase 10
VYTIEDALSFISKPETLSDVANRNNLKGDATKQLFIDTLPPVLILHLKRFVYDSRAGGVLKSHKVVSYGTELEVPKDCLAPAKRTSAQMARKNHYRLNGVVFHHGKSAAGGHYTVLQRQNNGRWLNIDDT